MPPPVRQIPLPPPIRSRKTKTRRFVTASARLPSQAKAKSPLSRAFRHQRRQPIRRELSAGGVAVRHERGQYLVALLKTEHKRGPVWVLPKGHVELSANEGIAEAARREVQEEAGLKDLSVKDQLGITRFAFQAENALVRKTVHYFLMTTSQKELSPQMEEGMLEAAWFPLDVAIATLAYDTDQEIVQRAKAKLLGTPVPVRQSARRGVRIRT